MQKKIIQIQMIKFEMLEEFIYRRGLWIQKLIHKTCIAIIREYDNEKYIDEFNLKQDCVILLYLFALLI